MTVIGLTGGIGSGKSTVATILAALGASVIDADKVGHAVYSPNSEGWRLVTSAFGKGILDEAGAIDRKQLGAIVFGAPAALARLNAIVHPLISAEVQRRIKALRGAGQTQPVVVEAAVLIEGNWVDLVDEIWLVAASPQAVMERLQAQRGLLADAVESRLRAQLSDEERRRYADVVIENSGSLADLRKQIEAAWARLSAAKR